jgi:3-dehydroquinate synthase
MERSCTTAAGSTLVAVHAGGLDKFGVHLAGLDWRELSGSTAQVWVAGPPSSVAVVTDQTVGDLYSPKLMDSVRVAGIEVREFRIEPGEASKNLETLGQVYTFFAQSRLARDGLVVALGGGVVSDLAGLAAATWMRGVRFAIVPTTLEAQIDAAIGGKTAVNICEGKNLVGVFHQPVLVLIDPICLGTLDVRDVRAGLAESVKHALICSEAFFSWHEDHAEAIEARDSATLAALIERNVDIKIDIVERDPFERSGERMLLNFGHTIGHAIETCCDYSLRHGECVALGMLAACRLSRRTGPLSSAEVERVETLLMRLGLPTRWSSAVPFDRIMEVIQRDKKSRGGQVRWVLLEAIGRTRITADVDETLVREAYESIVETSKR